MTRILILYLISLVSSILNVNGQAPAKQNYKYFSDTKSNLSLAKIEKSSLNKFIDTAEFTFQGGCILPNEYKTQNLKDGKHYQYFLQDTTKIAFELSFRDNMLITFKSYWFNDSLKQTGQIVGGLNEGKWTGYYRNGKISEIFIWTQGIHHEFFFYFPNGTLKRHSKELNIKNGKYRHWETEDYYSNGKLKQKGQTKNGYKIKIWTYYNQDGSIKETKKHKKPEWLGPAD